ncbi:hypothetical protein HK096_011538, partial [Nowakowskiella sp. JEL0078]
IKLTKSPTLPLTNTSHDMDETPQPIATQINFSSGSIDFGVEGGVMVTTKGPEIPERST